MVFLSLYASVRLACYQGKMYSRHLFPYKRLSYIFLCFKIKTRKNQLGLNKIHSKPIHKIGITLMTYPIPVEGSFKTSASPIETFRFCEPSKLGGNRRHAVHDRSQEGLGLVQSPSRQFRRSLPQNGNENVIRQEVCWALQYPGFT